jgi:hypothetical protein
MNTPYVTSEKYSAPAADIMPERRIRDVEAARATFKKHWDNDDQRRRSMAQTRNQLEGGRPFNPEQLERDGASWMTNVNFRDAEAAFNRTYLPYWKMVNDVPNKVAVTVHSMSPHADKWSKAIAESFDLFLDDWGADYFANFMAFTQDVVKFGPGYVVMLDPDSPRYEHVRTEQMVLPKRAKANPDKWEICSFKREMTVADLWKHVRTPKDGERSAHVGWNASAIKQALKVCKGGGTVASSDDWSKVQDEITSNDIAMTDDWAPIEVVYQFVKGHDGKIAHYIFTESTDVKDFLFAKEDYAEAFRHIIGAVFFDVGVGQLVHTIKGFAIKNYHFSVLQNRAKSRLMDAATMGMSMNFQRNEDTPSETPPVESYGAINIFPRGIAQLNIYPQLQQAQTVIQLLAGNAAENNGVYRDPSKQIGETNTARQATILASLSEEIGNATSSIYLTQIGERVFAEQVRRLMRKGNRDADAVKFQRRLTERGMPKNAFGVELTVKTGANPGTAGAALRDMIFEQLLGISRMPGINQRWILEQYLANKLGTQAVNKALLPEGQESAPMQRRMAMMENAHLGQGMPLPVDPADAHFEHCDEHIKPLEAIVAQFKEQGDIAPEMAMALQMALPHVDAHFELLQADETMKDAYGQVWPRYSNVRSIAQAIFSQLQQAQTEQQPPVQ